MAVEFLFVHNRNLIYLTWQKKHILWDDWKDREPGLENKQELWKARQSWDHEIIPWGHARHCSYIPVTATPGQHCFWSLLLLDSWLHMLPPNNLWHYLHFVSLFKFQSKGLEHRTAWAPDSSLARCQGKDALIPSASITGTRAQPDAEQPGKTSIHCACFGCLRLPFPSFGICTFFPLALKKSSPVFESIGTSLNTLKFLKCTFYFYAFCPFTFMSHWMFYINCGTLSLSVSPL